MDQALALAKLQERSLGAPAAERDDELLRTFVYSDVYRDFDTGKASIVIGSRGAGKSAIFRRLAEDRRSRKDCVVEISPEHYSYEILSQSIASEVKGNWRKQSSYSVAWQYALLITAVRSLCDAGRTKNRKVDAQLTQFLADHFRGEQHDPKSTLLSYLKRFESLKLGIWGEFGLQTKELDKLYKLEELHQLMSPIRDELSRQPVYILVDELDRGWDGSEDAQFFVSGLFQASIELNKISPNLRVLISLRQELYDNIPSIYEDAQKVRDLIRYVRWSPKSLRQLIEKRFASVLGSEAPLDDGWWYFIFEEGLSYRKTDSFKYIIDRTTLRPRELIQLCSDCIQIHQEGNDKLNYKSIFEAERLYSRDRIDDIAQEYRFRFPGIKEIYESFRGMVFSFTREELENHCIDILTSIDKYERARQWLENQDELYLLKALWETEFLRVHVVGNQKGTENSGSTYTSYYQAPGLNLQAVNRFQVHPMFRSYLGMKEK